MKAAPPQLISKFSTLAPGYDVLLCDIWGVVHNGLAVHPHACDALMRARAKGATVVLVTNAPRPVRAEALHGVAADPAKPGVDESPGALLAAS